MAVSSTDFFKPKTIVFLVVAFFLIGLVFHQILKGPKQADIDKTDYKAVAVYFVYHNPIIAKQIGKVISHDYVGAGGGGGQKISYNVIGMRGEEKFGVCFMTLKKDEKGFWYVDEASMNVGGIEFKVPVIGNVRRGLKLF